jgi:hypothetical protein
MNTLYVGVCDVSRSRLTTLSVHPSQGIHVPVALADVVRVLVAVDFAVVDT